MRTDAPQTAARKVWQAIRRAAIAVHDGAVWLFEPAWTSLEKQLNNTDWRPIAAKIFGLMVTMKVGFVVAATEAIKDPTVIEALSMLLGSLFIGFIAALTRFHHGLPRDTQPPTVLPPSPQPTDTAPSAPPANPSPTGPA